MALEMLIDILTRMTGRCSIHFPGRVAIGQKVTGWRCVDYGRCTPTSVAVQPAGGSVLRIAPPIAVLLGKWRAVDHFGPIIFANTSGRGAPCCCCRLPSLSL
jgi:hypothetical protein